MKSSKGLVLSCPVLSPKLVSVLSELTLGLVWLQAGSVCCILWSQTQEVRDGDHQRLWCPEMLDVSYLRCVLKTSHTLISAPWAQYVWDRWSIRTDAAAFTLKKRCSSSSATWLKMDEVWPSKLQGSKQLYWLNCPKVGQLYFPFSLGHQWSALQF